MDSKEASLAKISDPSQDPALSCPDREVSYLISAGGNATHHRLSIDFIEFHLPNWGPMLRTLGVLSAIGGAP